MRVQVSAQLEQLRDFLRLYLRFKNFKRTQQCICMQRLQVQLLETEDQPGPLTPAAASLRDLLTEFVCFKCKREVRIAPQPVRNTHPSRFADLQHSLKTMDSSFKFDQTTEGGSAQPVPQEVHAGAQQLTRGSQMASDAFCVIQSSRTTSSHLDSGGN